MARRLPRLRDARRRCPDRESRARQQLRMAAPRSRAPGSLGGRDLVGHGRARAVRPDLGVLPELCAARVDLLLLPRRAAAVPAMADLRLGARSRSRLRIRRPDRPRLAQPPGTARRRTGQPRLGHRCGEDRTDLPPGGGSRGVGLRGHADPADRSRASPAVDLGRDLHRAARCGLAPRNGRCAAGRNPGRSGLSRRHRRGDPSLRPLRHRYGHPPLVALRNPRVGPRGRLRPAGRVRRPPVPGPRAPRSWPPRWRCWPFRCAIGCSA